MMVPLRRLRESFPALCTGFPVRGLEFAELGIRLAEELRRLRRGKRAFRPDGICPLDFLALFPAERRLAVLNGDVEYGDWRYAAAVRLARALRGRSSGAPLTVLDGEVSAWLSDPLLAEGSGLAEFVRRVLGGAPGKGSEALLAEPVRWRGMTLRGFVAAGSTSRVYLLGGAAGEGEKVLKLPCPGGEARFRREIEVLRRFDHPHLPKLCDWSLDGAIYCVLERCRTGRAIREERGSCAGALLSALDYVHRAGVLHGDIRLCNLGIAAAGVPLLLDFSHARNAVSPEESAAEMEKMKRLLA